MTSPEEWAISPHPLAPHIPMNEWLALTEEQQRDLHCRINRTYERISNQQTERYHEAEEIARKFKKLPFWKRFLCLIGLHDIDDSMREEHAHRPDTFMRVTYCRRCGSQFYDSPFGLRRCSR
ncbi:hypothetical protein KKH23_06510 [Patescibacteria group bacterium]|nr:hypothetical protein [Patescibacteria group bacterium]